VPTFNEYITELYPQAMCDIGQRADVPLLNAFERVPVLVAYLLEFGDIQIPDTLGGRAVQNLAVKGINESRAFIARAKVGTSWRPYHHYRAMIELLLSSHYLVCKPHKQQERLEKSEEYPYLRALMPHLEVEAKRHKKHEPTTAELERAALLTPARHKQLEEHTPTFRRLWGAKLTSVLHWHHPDRVTSHWMDEMRNSRVKLPFRIFDHEELWDRQYEHMCHASHVSPSGHYILGSVGKLPILGLQERPLMFLSNIVSLAEG